MLSLSPAKLLVLLVVALIVLGPEKLPQVARQLGAAWGELRRFRSRLESDVRGAFPDLPATHEVAQAVRSPLAFLDRLADEHEKASAAATGEADEVAGAPLDAVPPAQVTTNGHGVHHDVAPPVDDDDTISGVGGLPVVVPDDPSMN
jgi:TatA/E family protein of Tat protein translocase